MHVPQQAVIAVEINNKRVNDLASLQNSSSNMVSNKRVNDLASLQNSSSNMVSNSTH